MCLTSLLCQHLMSRLAMVSMQPSLKDVVNGAENNVSDCHFEHSNLTADMRVQMYMFDARSGAARISLNCLRIGEQDHRNMLSGCTRATQLACAIIHIRNVRRITAERSLSMLGST